MKRFFSLFLSVLLVFSSAFAGLKRVGPPLRIDQAIDAIVLGGRGSEE